MDAYLADACNFPPDASELDVDQSNWSLWLNDVVSFSYGRLIHVITTYKWFSWIIVKRFVNNY